MPSFSLDHLDDTQFEEFCFELLGELGYVNARWRKGTGLSSSPADRGRDIECERVVTDEVDGSTRLERYYVECKHYEKGVPPEKLLGALTWATAGKPDWLIIIASNFLSNPTKDFIEEYQANYNPHLKIKQWERPQLEKLTVGHSRLLSKYNVPSDFSYLQIMHPAHLLYTKTFHLNTMAYFFDVLDKLDPQNRNNTLGWAYYPIIRPRKRQPVTGKEKVRDLYIDEVSYDAFKRACFEMSNVIDGSFLVHAVVNFALQGVFSIANKTDLEDKIEKMQDSIDFWRSLNNMSEEEIRTIEERLRTQGGDQDSSILQDRSRTQEFIEVTEKQIRALPGRTEENYRLYQYFCENVIEPLLQERIL